MLCIWLIRTEYLIEHNPGTSNGITRVRLIAGINHPDSICDVFLIQLSESLALEARLFIMIIWKSDLQSKEIRYFSTIIIRSLGISES